MVAGASMLIGLFGGMEIQGCRDAAPTAAAFPVPIRNRSSVLGERRDPRAAVSDRILAVLIVSVQLDMVERDNS
jgi:hypothetical protein